MLDLPNLTFTKPLEISRSRKLRPNEIEDLYNGQPQYSKETTNLRFSIQIISQSDCLQFYASVCTQI